MIFLAIAWVLLIIFFLAEIIKYKSRDFNFKRKVTSFQILVLIMMVLYSLIGIATKDPLSDIICQYTGFCVPSYIEWVVYVGILGALIWKFILVDMKADITTLKTENKSIYDRLGKVEGTTDIIKNNIDKIMDKCLNTNCKSKKA